jgi:hypothetical protein
MKKPSLDGRHRDQNGEIIHKHGNTLVLTLRKIYGQSFAAGYPIMRMIANPRWIGTPYRHPKRTPLNGAFGR